MTARAAGGLLDAMQTPPPIAVQSFADADAAVARIVEIYERNTAFLRDRFVGYGSHAETPARARACYPFVRVTAASHERADSRLSYGFVSQPGVHETTLTRPDIFARYYREQIELLLANHGGAVEVGESDEPIPVHFAYRRDINLETEAARRGWPAPAAPLRDV